jgi:hypothetical protein
MKPAMRPLLAFALVAIALGYGGCLRFGYSEQKQARDSGSDSGADGGSGPNEGGAGGRGGASGAGAGGDGQGGDGGGGGAGGDPAADGGSHPEDGGATDAGATDASVTDASVTDASVTDADPGDEDGGEDDPDAGASLCPERSDALFCDGFEDPNFDRWSYAVINNGTATRSTTFKRTGEASLRATTGAAMFDNAARYATNELGSLKSGELWMRYYYFLPNSVTINSHISAGVMSEIQEPWAGFSLIVRASRVDLSTMSGPVQGTMTFPRQRWVCVELHVTIDPSAGRFEAYLDGALAVRSGPTNSVPADGYRNAEVGIHYAEAAQGPVEAYVDDVFVGRSRIPCDP